MFAKKVTAAAAGVAATEAFATAKALRGVPSTKGMEATTGLRRLVTGKGFAPIGRAPKRTAPKRTGRPLRKLAILKARWRWTIGPLPIAVESAPVVKGATFRKAGAIPWARVGPRRIDCRLHVVISLRYRPGVTHSWCLVSAVQALDGPAAGEGLRRTAEPLSISCVVSAARLLIVTGSAVKAVGSPIHVSGLRKSAPATVRKAPIRHRRTVRKIVRMVEEY